MSSKKKAKITKTILLTGASGYLGQHLIAHWLKEGFDDTIRLSSHILQSTQKKDEMTTDDDDDDTGAANVDGGSTKDVPETLATYHYEIIALYNKSEGFAQAVKEMEAKMSTSAPSKERNHTISISPHSFDLTTLSSKATNANNDHQNDNENDVVNIPSFLQNLDLCIHTAALSSPRKCQTNPSMAYVINVPKKFFQIIQSIPKIILSTDQVYDGMKYKPQQEQQKQKQEMASATKTINEGSWYDEDVDIPNPINVYAKTKYEMESYLSSQTNRNGNKNNRNDKNDKNNTGGQEISEEKGKDDEDGTTSTTAGSSCSRIIAPSCIVLRSSIIIGPKAPVATDLAHDTFLHFCYTRESQPTTFFTNEYRTVVSVRHVCKVIQFFVKKLLVSSTTINDTEKLSPNAVEVYNMGGPNRLNRYDMAEAVFQQFGYDKKFLIKGVQESPTSPLDISMNSQKLFKATNIEHEPATLDELVSYTLKDT